MRTLTSLFSSLLISASLLLTTACSSDAGDAAGQAGDTSPAGDIGTKDTHTSDVGANDSSITDAGMTDTGATDSGTTDAGMTDTGTTDTGATDAGTADTAATDAGVTDTGIADTSATDAGVTDIGTADTGATDAGVADTGTADTGTTDVGTTDTSLADVDASDTSTTDTGTPSDAETDTGPEVVTCTPNDHHGCYNTEIYWFSSCDVRGSLVAYCTDPEECLDDGAGSVSCARDLSCTAHADCLASEYCDEAQCVPDVCAPSTPVCVGNAALRCNAEGSGWDVVLECGADGSVCNVSGNLLSCKCTNNAWQGCSNTEIYWFDSCGTRKNLVSYCTAPQECQLDGTGAPVCVDTSSPACPACPGAMVCDDTLETPACISSVADSAAPYYEDSCVLTHTLAHPTTLDADCRCFNNRAPSGGLTPCIGEQYLAPSLTIGAGPTVKALPQSHINGGFVDATAREIIAGVDWSSAAHPDSGLIMAFHLDSGDRRVLSGAYDDPTTGYAETGAGPSFANVIDVELGPDGLLYALSVPGSSVDLEIIAVDPATGDRTRVWKNGDSTFAQCASGDGTRALRVWGEAFTLDAAGNIHLAFGGAGFYSEGVGVIRVAADGSTCEFVTRSGAGALNDYAESDVGGGADFDRSRFQSLTFHDGDLYALHLAWHMLVRIDPVTGDRAIVSSASTSQGVVGAGPVNYGGIGDRWLTYDADRGFMWASGVLNTRTITAVDLTTGDRTEVFCRTSNPTVPWRELCLTGVAESGFQNYGGLWIDPANGDLVFSHENVTLTRIDVVNGNATRLSR